jgi:predicted HicB family RNase H-like nuclease
MAILNIKDFPDDLHRKSKAEAALMGISLKDFIIRAMTEYLEKKKRGVR